MAFKEVGNKNLKPLGRIIKSPKGYKLLIDPSCDIILYDRVSKSYYQLLGSEVHMQDKNNLQLLVDLDNPSQVEFKIKD